MIDPVLSYSTYLGGPNQDESGGIAVDAAGSAYITGFTASANFPTVSPLQAQCDSCAGSTPKWDIFVSKLNPAGTALVYSTFLGGSGNDLGGAIAVDSSGNAYITGSTDSLDFPTHNPLQSSYGGSDDAFAAKLNPTGSALVYSTYLGGFAQDGGNGIAVDGSGDAFIGGFTYSTTFPTSNPVQANNKGNADGFVAELNPGGSALIYSTYVGGSAEDSIRGIALDASGNAYITGYTESSDFPTVNPIQNSYAGGTCSTGTQTFACPDVFVAKLNSAGSALVYSTYLGGGDQDFGNSIAVDSAGSAYVTGYTLSLDFPTASPFQSHCDGCGVVSGAASGDAFVAKLNPAGSALTYSTYLGGSGDDQAQGISLDAAGDAYVTGQTYSTDFPTVDSIQSDASPYFTSFVTELNPTGSDLEYSTYLGGSLGEQCHRNYGG